MDGVTQKLAALEYSRRKLAAAYRQGERPFVGVSVPDSVPTPLTSACGWDSLTEGRRLAVLVDDREKLPYEFGGSSMVTLRRVRLATGDYSIEGHEREVAVERKSRADYINSITSGYSRFAEEMKRLSAFRYRCIAVECNPNVLDIGNGFRNCGEISRIHFGLMAEFQIQYIFGTNRDETQRAVLQWMAAVSRIVDEGG